MLSPLYRLVRNRAAEGKLLASITNRCTKIAIKIISRLSAILKKLARPIDRLLAWPVCFIISKRARVKNQVLFITFQSCYTCNPKWITEALLRANVGFPLVWAINSKNASVYPAWVNLVELGSYEFYREAASSRIVVENMIGLERWPIFKKKDQFWIQTWHGALGIKKLETDQKWQSAKKNCHRDTNFLYSNSTFETEVYHSTWWKDVPALEVGHARNDILFTADEVLKAKIRDKVNQALGITSDVKIFLYAPTFRDRETDRFCALDYALIKNALEERFGGTWHIALRLHFRLKQSRMTKGASLPDCVSDATAYDDIQELMLCADAGLTDYSSWIFDYVLTRRPGFIILPDREYFESTRGFYYPIETTPFPIAADSQGVAENIRGFDAAKYDEAVTRFLKERGCVEDGHACERIVEHILGLMKDRP